MNATQLTLWERILSFQIDDGTATFPFSARLAAEQKWSADFTKRAILEYKRFIFLCCILPKGASPSKIVDEVWHLHLTYTRSYWDDFCRDTLGQDIHHMPSKGGGQEDDKHKVWYAETLTQYKRYFNTPPADIWPPPEPIRTPELPPINPRFYAFAAFFLSLPFFFSYLLWDTFNPFHLKGPQFLVFFPFFVGAVILTEITAKVLRSKQYRAIVEKYLPDDATPYQIAALLHNHTRAIQTGVVDLIERDLLTIASNKYFTLKRHSYIPRPGDTNPLIGGWEQEEEDIITFDTIKNKWYDASKATHPLFLPLYNYFNRQLQFNGLGYIIVLSVGISRCIQGLHYHKPIGFLVFQILFGMLVLFIVKNNLPSRKKAFANSIRGKYLNRDASTPMQFSMDGAAAIRQFGDSAMLLAAIGIYYSATNSDSSSSGSSCGSSGSSCGSSCGGGGGCGGCGGGGD